MRRTAAFVVLLLGLAGCRTGGQDATVPSSTAPSSTATRPSPTATTPSSRPSATAPEDPRTPPLVTGDRAESLRSGGRTRTYLVHAPASRPPHPAVVLSLHGSLGTGAGQAGLTGMDAVADRYGFVVVYPDGVDTSWADGRGVAPADLRGVDDVAFLVSLVHRLVRAGADPRRVFVTGMSNGAFMAQRLACERADLVAAIAPVAGTYGAGLRCRPARPVPVLAFHGTADPIVPYRGGRMVDRSLRTAVIESAPQAFDRWAGLDGCTGRTSVDAPQTVVTRATGCAAGTAVELWSVQGTGHTWPGGPQYLPAALVGTTTDAVDASTLIWRFFARHPRR